MRWKEKRMLVLALIVFLLIGFGFAGTSVAARKVPDFTLPSVTEGKVIDIREYRGKVVLINFWATWCPPCRMEIPSLIRLLDEYKKGGLSVLGISMDDGNSKGVVSLMRKMGVNYPVVMGDPQIAAAFGGVFAIPTSFLIDREGRIAQVYQGYVDHDILKKAIIKLIR